MQIFARTLKGQTFTLDVKYNDTIKSVKQQLISKMENTIIMEQILLIFCNKPIEDNTLRLSNLHL